jgi:hypothetical protein
MRWLGPYGRGRLPDLPNADDIRARFEGVRHAQQEMDELGAQVDRVRQSVADMRARQRARVAHDRAQAAYDRVQAVHGQHARLHAARIQAAPVQGNHAQPPPAQVPPVQAAPQAPRQFGNLINDIQPGGGAMDFFLDGNAFDMLPPLEQGGLFPWGDVGHQVLINEGGHRQGEEDPAAPALGQLLQMPIVVDDEYNGGVNPEPQGLSQANGAAGPGRRPWEQEIDAARTFLQHGSGQQLGDLINGYNAPIVIPDP